MDPKCLDLIESQFVDAFNGLQELHDGGQLDECINGANSLLQDVAVPRYVRMKTLMLLADSVQDWKEAEGHRSQAEVLWQIERVCYVQGDNKVVDEVLDNLRVDLNELCAELGKKRRPVASQEMFDAKYATERHMAAHKEAVKKYEETVDDEDELERIDLEILGMTREQSLAILDRKAAKVSLSLDLEPTMF